MFASSRHLHLELFCTHGTPVMERLGYLPASGFPIVISFLGRFLDGDRDNLIAALGHRDRVQVVEINAPLSLFEELVTVIQEPLPALTYWHLHCHSDKSVPKPILPDTFLGGSAPRLKTINIAGIRFPTAPTFLSSARNLVDVILFDIQSGDIPPEAMVANLAALPKLKYLSLTFAWRMSYHDRMHLPSITRSVFSALTRSVLPALTKFTFHGLFEYFEDFVAHIEAPQLNFLEIEYHDQDDGTDYQFPQLRKFIDRSVIPKSSCFRNANLSIDHYTAVIKLDWGQSSFHLSVQEDVVDQVVNQLSSLLFKVDGLFISSRLRRDFDIGKGIRWLELLRPFTAVKVLSVDEDLSYHFPLALNSVTGEGVGKVLPALKLLFLEAEPVTSMKEFVAARQNVGCPVTFIRERWEFNERLDSLLNSLDVCEY